MAESGIHPAVDRERAAAPVAPAGNTAPGCQPAGPADEEAAVWAEIEALTAYEERLAAAARERAARREKARAEFEARITGVASAPDTDRTTAAGQGAPEPGVGASPVPNDEADPADGASEPGRRRKSGGWRLGRKVWHFSCEGERLGPVTFAALRDMAEVGKLDPRLDMVWKKGMADWQPAGRIDGLFEKRHTGSVVPATVKAPAAPRFSRRSRPVAAATRLPSWWPGMGRGKAILIALLFPAAWHILTAAGLPVLSSRLDASWPVSLFSYAPLLSVVVMVYCALQRLANLGMSRWWGLAVLVPVLNLWLIHRCLAGPPGYARHRQMDRPGWLLTAGFAMALVTALGVLAPLATRGFSIKAGTATASAKHGATIMPGALGQWLDTSGKPAPRPTATPPERKIEPRRR